MANNYQYTRWTCLTGVRPRRAAAVRPSAAVYGAGQVFSESREHEAPLNVYGYRNFCSTRRCAARFDQRARKWAFVTSTSTACANKYKGRMASVAFHHFNQYLQTGKVKLFEGYDGYPTAGQMRDFVSVEDVVKVNPHFLDHPESPASSIWAAAAPQPFERRRRRRRQRLPPTPRPSRPAWRTGGTRRAGIHRLPDALKGKYQSFTEANISARAAGCTADAERGGRGAVCAVVVGECGAVSRWRWPCSNQLT